MTTSFKLLKGILSIALFFSTVLWLIFLLILVGIISGIDGSFGLHRVAEDFDLISKGAKLALVTYILVGYAGIIYIIYILRKLIISLNSGNLFTKFQCTGFNLVGQLIIWLVILSAVVEFVMKLIFDSRLEVETNFPDFWLFLALGAFFIVLSQVFEKARLMREENDLTI